MLSFPACRPLLCTVHCDRYILNKKIFIEAVSLFTLKHKQELAEKKKGGRRIRILIFVQMCFNQQHQAADADNENVPFRTLEHLNKTDKESTIMTLIKKKVINYNYLVVLLLGSLCCPSMFSVLPEQNHYTNIPLTTMAPTQIRFF